MAAEDLIKVITEEISDMISTKTVIGEYITVEGTTIIPVTKVTFGFGSGAGESGSDEKNKGIGGGGGGGATVIPIAFMVITPGDVKLLTIKERGVVTQIAEIMPELLDTSKSVIEAAAHRKKESPESIEESEPDTDTE
ncbi:MAG: spore germination protein GerW family protein [Euryarchaeota archaeon]|nr:spore germination protein GerW family protein [Euryarchaeota archaeon]